MSNANYGRGVTHDELILSQIDTLKREIDAATAAHGREHGLHDGAHSREHEYTDKALQVAAELAKANKADANEWRAAMADRELRFAPINLVNTMLERLDKIERANLVRDEREQNRLVKEADDKRIKAEEDGKREREIERRQSRQQWTVGIVITFVVILVNFVIRAVFPA